MEDNFYAELTPFADFGAVADPATYTGLPGSWLLVLTDLVGSTDAINKGLYKVVNALGAASIVAVVNALRPLSLPYQFGGDGAVIAVPMSARARIEPGLRACVDTAREAFGMSLRVGLVPVSWLREQGAEVAVAKFQPHPHYQQAMFVGDGLERAEQLLKQAPSELQVYMDMSASAPRATGAMEGFECRWDDLPAPGGQALALIVKAIGPDVDARHRTYREVQDQIADIYGPDPHPVEPRRTRLTLSPAKLGVEGRIRQGKVGPWSRLGYQLKLLLLNLAGNWLMWRGVQTKATDWGGYKQRLKANCDHRKFDNSLRMVIAGTPQQHQALHRVLHELRARGRLAYGLHAAPHSLITCLLFDYDQRHVHFLDVSGGGYAIAARMLKAQLADAGQGSPEPCR